MGADLNNIVKCQKLTDDHVQFLIYQILRGLKVGEPLSWVMLRIAIKCESTVTISLLNHNFGFIWGGKGFWLISPSWFIVYKKFRGMAVAIKPGIEKVTVLSLWLHSLRNPLCTLITLKAVSKNWFFNLGEEKKWIFNFAYCCVCNLWPELLACLGQNITGKEILNHDSIYSHVE